MGRPRKPTAMHELEGTRPGATNRARTDTKASKAKAEAAGAAVSSPAAQPGLGDPPAQLRDTKFTKYLSCWHELVAAIPPGVALQSDRFTVEIAARLLARLRSTDPLQNLSASELGSLQRALGSLGMTPADRSKVGAQPDEPKKHAEADPWDKLGAIGGRA
jgi:hypothetical protein